MNAEEIKGFANIFTCYKAINEKVFMFFFQKLNKNVDFSIYLKIIKKLIHPRGEIIYCSIYLFIFL